MAFENKPTQFAIYAIPGCPATRFITDGHVIREVPEARAARTFLTSQLECGACADNPDACQDALRRAVSKLLYSQLLEPEENSLS